MLTFVSQGDTDKELLREMVKDGRFDTYTEKDNAVTELCVCIPKQA